MAKTKYYAVKTGKKPGIYLTWNETKEQILGFPNAKYKSFKTKEEALNYLNNNTSNKRVDSIEKQVNNLLNEGKTVIFTDGSYEKEKNIGSWAFIILRKNKRSLKASGLVTNDEFLESHNIAGEVYAVINAVKYSSQKGFDDLVIFHDYEGLANWYDGSWDTKKSISMEYVKALKKFNLRIEFVWVKGHSNIYYNELVDKLAASEIEKRNK